MRKSIRTVLNASFLYIGLACSAIAAAGVWASGEWFFSALYRRSVGESLAHAHDRLVLFDELIAQAELEAREKGGRALRALGERFRTAADLESWSPEDLKRLARSHGVTEVYFINREGRVFASSFIPDLDFDLFSAGGEDFSRKLRSLFGLGIVSEQRLSQSINTGIINSYQYYSPEGAEILIETSTRIREAVNARFPGLGYDGLLQAVLLGSPGREASESLVRIVDFVGLTGNACWSIFDEGASRMGYFDLAAAADRGGSARLRTGDRELMAVTIAFNPRDYAIANTRRFGILEVNRSPLLRFRLFSLLSFLGASALSLGISLWVLKRRAVRTVAERAERLAQAIRKTATEGDAFQFHEGECDEFNTIARCVSELTGTIEKATAELGGALKAKDALLHEVHHRVRNNLQFVLSLINLKLSSCHDEGTEKVLLVLKNHIFSMALVQEHIHGTPELAAIDLVPYLTDLAHKLVSERPGPHVSVHVDSVIQGAAVTVDQAVPLGIIVAELLTNSMQHAFPPGYAASVRLEISRRDGQYSVLVADNGVGGDPAAPSRGIGMIIVRALTSQLDGALRVEQGGGMRVRLDFPVAA